MQIPAEYGEDFIVLAISVGLATIGVCVFCAACFGSRTFYFFMEDTVMNNDNTTKENATKTKIMEILSYALCFLIFLAIVIGVKSCIKNSSMPEEFKEAKKLLKKEGFSCRYLDEEEDFEELFDDLGFDPEGVTEVLIAYDENSEEMFLIACCEDVSSAKNLEFDLAWEIAGDKYLYNMGYTTKVNYRTVYFGHKDLIAAILD